MTTGWLFKELILTVKFCQIKIKNVSITVIVLVKYLKLDHPLFVSVNAKKLCSFWSLIIFSHRCVGSRYRRLGFNHDLLWLWFQLLFGSWHRLHRRKKTLHHHSHHPGIRKNKIDEIMLLTINVAEGPS